MGVVQNEVRRDRVREDACRSADVVQNDGRRYGTECPDT